MKRFWIAVASREHVLRGVAGGYVQVCHGKPGPLKQMAEGDWIIYYSPTEIFGEKSPYQRFTAIGKIKDEEPYRFEMSKDFVPWRRNVYFFTSQEADIKPLLDGLTFIPNKQRWGFPFRRGCFQISKEDFNLIIKAMGVNFDE